MSYLHILVHSIVQVLTAAASLVLLAKVRHCNSATEEKNRGHTVNHMAIYWTKNTEKHSNPLLGYACPGAVWFDARALAIPQRHGQLIFRHLIG